MCHKYTTLQQSSSECNNNIVIPPKDKPKAILHLTLSHLCYQQIHSLNDEKSIIASMILYCSYRRVNHHQSTGSLHSADSQSSNGLSPSPSPSPYNRTTPSPRNGTPQTPTSPGAPVRNGGGGGGVVNGTPVNGTTPSPLANKRWSSTSDFHSGSNQSLFSQNSAMAARYVFEVFVSFSGVS